MTNALTIALAQQDFIVGDIRGNRDKIIASTREATGQGADLVLFPEMTLTGYPAEDLLFKEVFQKASMQALEEICEALADCPTAALVGGYEVIDGLRYNSCFLVDQGNIVYTQHKHWLPNYGVFDEKRVFMKGPLPEPVEWRGVRLGILICEDLWQPELPQHLADAGAEILLGQNASPYEMGKAGQRKQVVAEAARKTGLPLVYLNSIGGQDELVFDGRSYVVDAQGNDRARLPAFEESLAITKWEKCDQWECVDAPMVDTQGDDETVYQAMVLGLRDYVNKNGFKGVVIGLSGGIDSGLTAAVAVDALGSERVQGIIMPSPYTSDESIEDAEQLADMLGIKTHTISISEAMQTYAEMLAPVFGEAEADTTEENIQARIRGNLLMAMSNKLGFMVLTTGNKSEMSVGYATLYGDMCGGYSVLKDVYKMMVFGLSHWRNQYSGGLPLLLGPISHEPAKADDPIYRSRSERKFVGDNIIPERMITKPPSAELKPDQKDEDSLPPYELLDAILHGLIEERKGIDDLVAEGHDAALIERIAKMIYIAEYKRRQSPPGVKVSGMSFGRDRRYPITNKWIWQRK